MPRNGRPPSMADVAQLVGVSHQTVSRVVNGKGRVSPRTCERVQSAIAQLGYRPNSVARALVTARSGIIGVVTTTSAHFGPSSMLIALEITAREAGFFTSVVALDRFSVEDVASAFDHFSSLAAEAIIVITPMDSLAEAVAAQGASVPVIAVSGGHAFGRGVSVVRADQRGGARELAEHLLSLGHRDIACVAGPQEWFVARERMAGWREAMDEAGLPKREPLIGLWEASWGYVALRILGCGGWCWHGVGACPMIEVATLQTRGGPDMGNGTFSALDMTTYCGLVELGLVAVGMRC